ncbi:MAG: type II toxin-antitoxin system VapC family toxin [Anaerolinea sp.]
MKEVILDAGVYIASVFPETYTPQCQALIRQLQAEEADLHAPALLRYELVAVARKAVYQGRVTAEEGLRARDRLLSYPVTVHFDDALLKRGYVLATLHNRPTAYDAQYLALAERLDCAFWTADERLYNAVRGTFPRARWVGAG